MPINDFKLYDVLAEKLSPEVALRIMQVLEEQQKLAQKQESAPSVSQEHLELKLSKVKLEITYIVLIGLGVILWIFLLSFLVTFDAHVRP